MVGASSIGPDGAPVAGPLGTGTLTLAGGSNLTTIDSNSYSIGNNIALTGGNTATLLGGSNGTMLTLGGMITGPAPLEVAAAGGDGFNTIAFNSPNSTFSGGLTIDSGGTTLIVGANSSGLAGALTSGPLGLGTVTLGDGTDLTTPDNSSFAIANALSLTGESLTLLGNNIGAQLELDGPITGEAGLNVVASEGMAGNVLTLANPNGTFSGGVVVYSGNTTLVVGSSGVGAAANIDSGPLGTGVLTLSDGNTLTTPAATPVTVLNDILIGTSDVPSTVILNNSAGGTLTLMGTISQNAIPAALVINGPTDIEGSNSYTGGTTVNNTTLTVGTDTGLGYGPLAVNAGTVSFTSSSPTLNNLSMTNASTINFAAGSTPSIIDMVSDLIGSGNAINLGTGTPTGLTIQVDGDPTFYGTINGNGSLVVTTNEQGLLDLAGANTYTGGTMVNPGAILFVSNNAALGPGTLTLNAGAELGVDHGVTATNQITVPADGVAIGGYGTISPASADSIAIQSGSLLTGGLGTLPGSDSSHLAVGTLTFGPNASVGLGAGGFIEFPIINATGTAGTDFSAIKLAGNLNITAGAGEFTIMVVGVDSTGLVIGTANSFNPFASYTWTLLSAGTITGNLNPNAFVINTSFFSNPTDGGQFTLTETATTLMLNFTPVPEPSTWVLMATGVCAVAGGAARRRRSS